MTNHFKNMIQELRNGGKTDEQIRQMFDADISEQPVVNAPGNIPASSTAFAQGADSIPVNLTYEEAEQLRQYAQNAPEGKQLSDKIYQQLQASPAYQSRQQGTIPSATPTPGQTGGTYEQNKFGDRAAEPLNLNQPVEQSQPTQKVNPPAEQSTPAPQSAPKTESATQPQPAPKAKPVEVKRTLDGLYQDMQAKKKKYLEMSEMWKNTNYTAYTQQQMNDAYNEYKVAYEQYQAHYRDMKGKHSAGDKGEKQLSQATTPKNVTPTDNALKEYQATQTAKQTPEPKVATIQEQATKNPGDWIYIGKGNAHADKNGWYQLKQGDIDWAKSKIQKA